MTEVLEAQSTLEERLRALLRIAIVPAYNEEDSVGRVLEEHTYRHRARRLLDLVGLREEAHV